MSPALARRRHRQEVRRASQPTCTPGWAYALKSMIWHQVDVYSYTSCSHLFANRGATWAPVGMLPNEVERCRKCEARRARLEAKAAEQARRQHATRDQLSFAF